MADRSPADPLIVSIDQGTSSTKVLVVDHRGEIVSRASCSAGPGDTTPGWVEQDADEIFESDPHAQSGRPVEGLADRIVAVGISNQRESAVIWDRATGEPSGPVLGWQDRRTAVGRPATRSAMGTAPCPGAHRPAHRPDVLGTEVRLAAGSGRSRPHHVPRPVKSHSEPSTRGCCIRLTGEHRIEVGNASRTQLLDLRHGGVGRVACSTCSASPAPPLPRIVTSIERPRRSAGSTGYKPTCVFTRYSAIRMPPSTATACGLPAPSR